jgi:hypothetical protein
MILNKYRLYILFNIVLAVVLVVALWASNPRPILAKYKITIHDKQDQIYEADELTFYNGLNNHVFYTIHTTDGTTIEFHDKKVTVEITPNPIPPMDLTTSVAGAV